MNKIDLYGIAKELSGLMPAFSKKLMKPLEQMAKDFMSPMQLFTLTTLTEKELFTMTELSQEMKISKQQMTPIVDKLVDLELVNREHDSNDRRTVNISITQRGLDFVKNFHEDITQFTKSKLERLGEEDLYTLHNSLVDLYRIIDKIK